MCVVFYLFVLSVCVSVDQVQAWCPMRPEEDARAPGAGVTASYGMQFKHRDSNLGPLKEPPVLLTTDPSP